MLSIKEKWDDFLSTPFPSIFGRNEDVESELISLDTFMAGCISTVIDSRGVLDEKRASVLRKCVADLEDIMPKIEGEGIGYFSLLLDISRDIINTLPVEK
jgi:hypothetical protein